MLREEHGFIEQLTAATRRMRQLEERLELMAPRNERTAAPAPSEPAVGGTAPPYPRAPASDESWRVRRVGLWGQRSRAAATPLAPPQLADVADAAEARSPASSPLRTGRIWTVTVGLVGR
jgi:hypothetical protein